MGSSQILKNALSGPRGFSKAHNSLQNILRIISTIPPEDTSANRTPESEFDAKREVKLFGIDLNVGFFEPPEADADANVENGGSAADFDSGVEASEYDAGETEELRQKSELSDDFKGHAEEGFMGLLIEAARLIFGDFNDRNYSADSGPKQESEKNTSESTNSDEAKTRGANDDSVAARRLKRQTQCWAVELYGNVEEEERSSSAAEASPVVRSKRGRVQMLPCKYKDSVLEPLSRFSRTRSTTILANRRRSRYKKTHI